MNFDRPFTSLLDIWDSLEDFFAKLIDFTSTEMNFNWWNDIPQIWQNLLTTMFPTLALIPNENMSVISFLLGSGISIILGVTFVKWIIGIIT